MAWVELADLEGAQGPVGDWGGPVLTASEHLDQLTKQGKRSILSATVAEAVGSPISPYASVEVLSVGNSTIQRVYGTAEDPRILARSTTPGGASWGPWKRTDSPTRTALHPLSMAGSLTDTEQARHVRLPVKVFTTVDSWELVFKNFNDRSSTNYGAVDFTGVYISKRASDGNGGYTNTFASDPISLGLPRRLSAGQTSERYSIPNISFQLEANVEYIISYAYTTPGGTPNHMGIGGSYLGTNPSGVKSPTVSNQWSPYTPLDVYLKLQISPETPFYVYPGSSSETGLNTDYPLRDCWAWRHAEAHGAVPALIGQSGTSLDSWVGGNNYVRGKFSTIARADKVIGNPGSNDLYIGASLSEMKTRYTAFASYVRRHLGDTIEAADVFPRRAETAAIKAVRVAFNTYLKSLPENILTCHDRASIVEDSNGLMRADFDSGDGIHLNTYGQHMLGAYIVKGGTGGGLPGAAGPAGPGVPAGGAPRQVIRKDSTGQTTEWATLSKAEVGLGNVDNTPDAAKPLSAPQAEALAAKADLVGGKVNPAQLPEATPLTDSTIAPLINGTTTGAAIDARINTQVAPQVQQLTASYIAGDRAVADAAAAAVNAAPKIVELENKTIPKALADAKVYTDANKWARPAMAGTADFNDYTTPGTVSVSTSGGKTNIPVLVSGALQTIQAGAITLQHYTTGETVPRTYTRRLNAGTWGAWAPNSSFGSSLAGGTDFDSVLTWGAYPVNLGTHPNQPVAVPGTLEVLPSAATQPLQRFTTSEPVPRIFQRRKTSTAWQEWSQPSAAEINGLTTRVTALENTPGGSTGGGESPTKYGHTVRLARARQVVGVRTSPRAQVALICDHGTVRFRDIVYPKLKELGLTCTLALNSQKMEGGSLYEAAEVDTWAQVKTWAAAGIEIANHGRTHKDTDSMAVLYDEIVTGHQELETALGRPVHSWVQPSASGDLGKWFGFRDGISWDSWANTDAGRMILDRHAVATGTIYPIGRYQLSGEPPIGMQGHWLDSDDKFQAAKDQVLAAQNEKTGVLLRMHPGYIGGQNSAESIHGFLEWLAAEKNAGRIDVVTLTQWALTRIV